MLTALVAILIFVFNDSFQINFSLRTDRVYRIIRDTNLVAEHGLSETFVENINLIH